MPGFVELRLAVGVEALEVIATATEGPVLAASESTATFGRIGDTKPTSLRYELLSGKHRVAFAKVALLEPRRHGVDDLGRV